MLASGCSIQAPEKEGLVHPTVEQVQAIIDAVENAQIEQAAGEEVPEAFLDPATLKGSKNAKVKAGLYGSRTFTQCHIRIYRSLKVKLLKNELPQRFSRIMRSYAHIPGSGKQPFGCQHGR